MTIRMDKESWRFFDQISSVYNYFDMAEKKELPYEAVAIEYYEKAEEMDLEEALNVIWHYTTVREGLLSVDVEKARTTFLTRSHSKKMCHEKAESIRRYLDRMGFVPNQHISFYNHSRQIVMDESLPRKKISDYATSIILDMETIFLFQGFLTSVISLGYTCCLAKEALCTGTLAIGTTEKTDAIANQLTPEIQPKTRSFAPGIQPKSEKKMSSSCIEMRQLDNNAPIPSRRGMRQLTSSGGEMPVQLCKKKHKESSSREGKTFDKEALQRDIQEYRDKQMEHALEALKEGALAAGSAAAGDYQSAMEHLAEAGGHMAQGTLDKFVGAWESSFGHNDYWK